MAKAFRNQHLDWLAEQRLPFVTKETFSCGVHQHDVATLVDHYVGDRGTFDGQSKRVFGQSALGDVAEDENRSKHRSLIIFDGCTAVVDRMLGSILCDQDGVVG